MRAKGIQKTKKQKLENETLTVEVTGQTEMEELVQLYESALEELSKRALTVDNLGDREQSKMLFRGVVHECDKMIRIRAKEIPNATEEEIELLQKRAESCPILPYDFYIIYANALYHLALVDLNSETKPIDFLNEAVERCHHAITIQDSPECHFAYARILIQKAYLDRDALEEFKSEFKTVLDRSTKENLGMSMELAHHAHCFLDNWKLPSEKIEWVEYNAKNWEQIIKIDPKSSQGFIGFGNGYLALADDCIQAVEEDDPNATVVEQATVVEYLQKALAAFEESKKIEESVQVYLLIGECNVHIGNLLDSENEEDNEGLEYYKKAVENFKKVRSMEKDALPEHFEEFLDEWEKDMQEI